jgi:fumarate reductase flavoprotein subunit
LTTGGLRIDPSSHVLTQEGKIIPGLYAAGDVTGSVEQKDGVTYGYGFDSAMAFGAIAADTIAEQVK